MNKKLFSQLLNSCSRVLPLLVIIQFVYIVVFVVINLTYQIPLAENFSAVLSSVQGANFDANAIQAGAPFLENFSDVQDKIELIKSLLFKLMGYMLLTYIFFGGALWLLSNRKIHPRKLLPSFGRFAALFASIQIPAFILALLLVYFLGKFFPIQGTASVPLLLGYILYAIGGLFAATTYSLTHHPLKKIYQRSAHLFFKKFPVLFANGIVILALVSLSFWLVSLAVEKTFSGMVIAIFAALVLLVLSRLYYIGLVQELDASLR